MLPLLDLLKNMFVETYIIVPWWTIIFSFQKKSGWGESEVVGKGVGICKKGGYVGDSLWRCKKGGYMGKLTMKM